MCLLLHFRNFLEKELAKFEYGTYRLDNYDINVKFPELGSCHVMYENILVFKKHTLKS